MRTSTSMTLTRQQLIDRGALIDVTDDARKVGVDVPTAISRRAWAACVEVYPETDNDNQRTRLFELLATVEHELAHRRQAAAALFRFPVVTTNRNHPPEHAELMATRHKQALTLTLANEGMPNTSRATKEPLPRQLLAELSITLSEFVKLAGAAEEMPLRRLEELLDLFSAEHPIPPEPVMEHNRFWHFPCPSVGRHSLAAIATAANPRERLLQNLDDIADHLSSVGLPAYQEEIEAFRTQLQQLSAPVTEMMHATAKLFRIAGSTSFENASNVFVHPYDVLLSIHARLAVLADAGRFMDVSQDDLEGLCNQITLLEATVPAEFLDELYSLRNRLTQYKQAAPLNELSLPPRELWCNGIE